MHREPLTISPSTSIIHNQSIGDAVRGVVDLGGAARIDDLDTLTIGNNRVAIMVDGNRAIERPMHRVAPEEAARTFHEIAVAVVTDDDGAQADGLLSDPDFAMSSRASSRPIRPKPQRTMSVFSPDVHVAAPVAPFSSSDTKSARSRVPPSRR